MPVLRAQAPAAGAATRRLPAERHDIVALAMVWDFLQYLPDDILVKLDRAAMAVSLETRVPLLDHRIIEFARSVPPAWKLRHGHGKWLLRRLLYQLVPESLVNRPKMGFGIPLSAWLRGPLREWAEATLDPVRLRDEGFLDTEVVRAKWREHLDGQRHWHRQLWAVLMWQSWYALRCAPIDRSAVAAA